MVTERKQFAYLVLPARKEVRRGFKGEVGGGDVFHDNCARVFVRFRFTVSLSLSLPKGFFVEIISFQLVFFLWAVQS